MPQRRSRRTTIPGCARSIRATAVDPTIYFIDRATAGKLSPPRAGASGRARRMRGKKIKRRAASSTGAGRGRARAPEAEPRDRLDQRPVRRDRQLAGPVGVPDQRRQRGEPLPVQPPARTPGWKSSGTCSPAWSCSARPYTLKVNEHVRVDLFYAGASERTRIWIDIVGGVLFLLPICVILVYFTWPWFVEFLAHQRKLVERRRPASAGR